MKTLIILNFVTRELWKFNFSKENFSKENFGKVLNFAEVEEVKKVSNFAEVESKHISRIYISWVYNNKTKACITSSSKSPDFRRINKNFKNLISLIIRIWFAIIKTKTMLIFNTKSNHKVERLLINYLSKFIKREFFPI